MGRGGAGGQGYRTGGRQCQAVPGDVALGRSQLIHRLRGGPDGEHISSGGEAEPFSATIHQQPVHAHSRHCQAGSGGVLHITAVALEGETAPAHAGDGPDIQPWRQPIAAIGEDGRQGAADVSISTVVHLCLSCMGAVAPGAGERRTGPPLRRTPLHPQQGGGHVTVKKDVVLLTTAGHPAI